MNSRTKENEKANGSPFLLLMDRIIPVTMIEASINSSRGNLLYFILIIIRIVIVRERNKHDGSRSINRVRNLTFLSFFLRIPKYMPAIDRAEEIPMIIIIMKKNSSFMKL